MTAFAYEDFMHRVQNNEFGEIAYQDDMVFAAEPPDNQWAQAMNIHMKGLPGPLFVPHPINGQNAPQPC